MLRPARVLAVVFVSVAVAGIGAGLAGFASLVVFVVLLFLRRLSGGLGAARGHHQIYAETFAVWLQPRAVWRKRYADWPALKKLEYVDELMEELKGARSAVRTRMHVDPLLKIRKTLRAYYTEKRERYLLSDSDMYDRDLTRLFSSQAKHRDRELASKFLRRNRPEVRRLVSRWTGEYQFTLDQVLNDMIGRCRELKLRAVGAERQLRMDFAVLLTAKTIQSLHNRRNWIAL